MGDNRHTNCCERDTSQEQVSHGAPRRRCHQNPSCRKSITISLSWLSLAGHSEWEIAVGATPMLHLAINYCHPKRTWPAVKRANLSYFYDARLQHQRRNHRAKGIELGNDN